MSDIPRSQVRAAIRACLALDYCVTGAQAWRLVKDWHETRGINDRRFSDAEFSAYIRALMVQPPVPASNRGKRAAQHRTGDS